MNTFDPFYTRSINETEIHAQSNASENRSTATANGNFPACFPVKKMTVFRTTTFLLTAAAHVCASWY